MTDCVGLSVTFELWSPGPVSPRTAMSQYWVPLTQAPVPPVMVVLPPVVVELGVADWLAIALPVNALYSATMFCWNVGLRAPTPIKYEALFQKMLFSSFGYETVAQVGGVVPANVALVPGAKWPGGHVSVDGMFAANTALCWIATR